MQQQGESGEDIVIVGAGLAGLAVALGLHRYVCPQAAAAVSCVGLLVDGFQIHIAW
jgi:aspartate oxidase